MKYVASNEKIKNRQKKQKKKEKEKERIRTALLCYKPAHLVNKQWTDIRVRATFTMLA